MSAGHAGLLVIFWTSAFVFVATSLITLVALGKRLLGKAGKKNQEYYLRRLFYVIILSIAGASVSAYKAELLESSPPPPTHEFVASRNSDIYHYPTCRFAQSIKPENIIFDKAATRGRMLHAGCPQ